MKRAALFLTFGAFRAIGLVTPACSLFTAARPAAKAAAVQQPGPEPVKIASRDSEIPPVDRRKVGDFYVHRFSGSYEKSPLTLTEETVALEAGFWVIDYTLEQPSGTTRLRVRLDPKTDSVRSVSKLDGTNELKVPLAAYEKLMDRTSFTADANDGLLAAEHGTCLMGPSELECETKSYKVWVGDKPATLSVAHSDSIPDRDLSGDITGTDGTLIYRSELVEMGTAGSPRHGVASR